jgi:hypothetical protein
MRSRFASVVVYGAISVLALFIAFLIGAHVGGYQYWQMDSSARASLLVHDLQAIRSGANQKLIGAKEVELDGAILQALRFQESSLSWLFWPFSESYDHEKYLHSVALYRKDHPSPTPGLDFGPDNERATEMEEYRAEVSRRTAQLIENYGK